MYMHVFIIASARACIYVGVCADSTSQYTPVHRSAHITNNAQSSFSWPTIFTEEHILLTDFTNREKSAHTQI